MHDEHVRRGRDARHRSEIAHEIVLEVRIEAHADRIGDGHQEQRIAVGRRFRRDLGPDGRSGAAAIVDDDLLPERFGELRRHDARHRVGAAAGRERDDEADRLHRVGLGVRGRRHACPSRDRDRAKHFECVHRSVPPPVFQAGLERPMFRRASRARAVREAAAAVLPARRCASRSSPSREARNSRRCR